MTDSATARLIKRNTALQARIDTATVLIRQAMEREHYSRHGGVSPSVPAPATCPACAPYREWLGGEGQ